MFRGVCDQEDSNATGGTGQPHPGQKASGEFIAKIAEQKKFNELYQEPNFLSFIYDHFFLLKIITPAQAPSGRGRGGGHLHEVRHEVDMLYFCPAIKNYTKIY